MLFIENEEVFIQLFTQPEALSTTYEFASKRG